MSNPAIRAAVICLGALMTPVPSQAEVFADGRPKVPDSLIERARGLSSEEVFAVLPNDMLQPGDVLVVDLFGQQEGGTIVGDSLFYYIMKTTKSGGLVVDGAIRDLEGIRRMDMPAYFREAHPSAISNVMITGINSPVRIGKATVMPGDLVFGDAEGVYFIPPALVQKVVDNADEVHIHDEWTRKMFDEGKYKSSEIYGTPKDPELKKEYDAYLKKRLEEIRKKNPQ
jgi:regulator of RNase E activity RraA